MLYTHVSGQYGPFYTRVISATMSEAPYVLDGLHHHAHQTDLRIVEHYTDTAGATDHVFGLCHLLGYRFAPRIKDLKDRKLYTVEKPGTWPLLAPLIGDTVETAAILGQWTELMRLKASIETGAVVPSVILRKLAAAGAGNVLSRALRALGRIERTLFTLQWLSDPALRQRSHAGLNKMGYPGRPCWTCLHSSLTLGRGARAAHQPGGVHALRGSRRVDAADGGLRSRRYGQGHA